MSVKINFNSEQILNRQTKKINKAQKYLNIMAVVYTDPYVPFRAGKLSQQVDYGAKTLYKKIVYKMVYARRQYYDLPNKNKTRHPKAAMRWFDEMKRIRGRNLTEEAVKQYGKE